MRIKVVTLDFDGVIVESNNIKHRAFLELFKEYPTFCGDIMAYHYAHNGVNRYDKFRHIMINILKREYDAELAKEWALKFSKLTLAEIIDCPFVEGALDFLKLFTQKYPLYLASATPIDELKIILDSRKIYKYFKHVYGAPLKKEKVLKEIISNEKVLPEEVLFIGDSKEDFQAAKDSGVSFVARLSGYDFDGIEVNKYPDLKGIQSVLLNPKSGLD